MTRAARTLAASAGIALTACQPLLGEPIMTDTRTRTALYRIVDKRPDGACTWATMTPVRAGGETTRAMFCNPRDVTFLGERAPSFQMATLLEKNGAAARLLPVTIGLDVSIGRTLPSGELAIMALPRPSPLYLDKAHAGLREVVARAAEAHTPVAFALADQNMVIDAAPIDRDTALTMLGMQETPPR